MSPPLLMVRTTDLDTAIRAVPTGRWGEWLGARAPLRVHGSVAMGPGRLLRLVREDGADEEYATCVAWGQSDEGVALVETGQAENALIGGLDVPAVRDALYAFALRDKTQSGVAIRIEPASTGERAPGRIPASRLIGKTERGWRIEYERSAALEFLSPLHRQEPPDVAVARHLTLRRCLHTEPLIAVMTVRDLENDSTLHLGSLIGRYEKPVSGEYAFREALAEVSGELTDRARVLGGNLRTVHRTVADDDSSLLFSPRPVTEAHVEQWRTRLCASATAACDRLLQSGSNRDLAERLPEVRALAEQLASKVRTAAGQRIRVHGALSLDRVQRLTDGRFVFVDFGRSGVMESPVFDLATLIRSVSRRMAKLGEPSLEKEVRAAILNGYFADDWDSDMLPSTPHRMLSLLQLFELDVAFQQLSTALESGREVDGALYGAQSTLDGRRS